MKGKEFYFAYGSNMDFNQMKKRCPSAIFYSVAALCDYQFVFGKFSSKSSRWGDRTWVANIVENLGDTVWGVVYLVSSEDLKKLDKFEGVGKESGYSREKRNVMTANSGRKSVWLYIVKKQGKPSDAYLKAIIKGANKSNLPKDYIRSLKAAALGKK